MPRLRLCGARFPGPSHRSAALLTRMKGGFYRDRRFPDLDAVLDHYAALLDENKRRELIEHLKSI